MERVLVCVLYWAALCGYCRLRGTCPTTFDRVILGTDKRGWREGMEGKGVKVGSIICLESRDVGTRCGQECFG